MTLRMVSDDERREVAERLRGLRGGWSSGECYYTIIHALGLPDTSREDGGHALYSLLADLIDPDCEEGRYSVARTARPVDREALLVLADELECDGDCNGCDMGGGIWCGAQVYAARRIREACGEVVG